VKAPELSRKYATAIFSLAVESWLVTLNAVNKALTSNVELAQTLQDQDRPFAERQQALDVVIPSSSTQQVRNLLYTMLKEGDISQLGEVIIELERMVRGGPLVQLAQVTTAVALSDTEMEQFRQKLRAKYGDSLEFNFKIDPTIMGGVVVQIGDKVIDGSVASRLTAMSNALSIR
jgi:F-type H+-transporting ATPase subunit delta